ncbi:MAG TPA: DNA mismatch repair endonuclease MutL [Syntrophomonadaceae bacterium]|nr:DNA mismatch repair endonuclease MutL [Syntrophomonadaceae bacterium]
MPIKLLDDDLINKIAAGEVIERPASIVKELIENAIDAEATNITVSILNGGKDYIEVEDDGVGFTPNEIPLAFLRHATSKISRENDLFNIRTMGFRGEALPSIASVAKITLYSNKSKEVGLKAELENGIIKELEDYPHPQGSRIIIADLFYNTPARKKFLKTTVTEGNRIGEIVNRYALARPDISFTFMREKKQYYKTPGNGNLLDAVKVVLGYELAESLLRIDYEGAQYKIQGLISNPDFTQKNRRNQYFFVNNRPIRSPMLYKAIDTSYKGLLISREQPAIILSITLNPVDVDVNIHPQKTEVRFKNEKSVFQVVYQTIRDKLVSIDYSPVHRWSEQVGVQSKGKIVGGHILESAPEQNLILGDEIEFIKPDFTDNFKTDKVLATEQKTFNLNGDKHVYKIIGQYASTYILMEHDGALWLIDQHAAEEKILYNRLKKQYEQNYPVSQILAFPVTLDLSSQDTGIVMDNIELFNQLGFNIELIGYDSIILRSAPAVSLGQEREVVLEIIELIENEESIDVYDEAIITIACKRAIKAGDRLDFHEMETIVMELLETENYRNCPHGRPTLIKLNSSDIARMFKR